MGGRGCVVASLGCRKQEAVVEMNCIEKNM